MFKEFCLTRALNGFQATEMVRTRHFDAVLMGIRMPLMNGLEATHNIRQFNKQIPIIEVTANAFDTDRINALAAGCNDFIARPIKKYELMEALIKCCKKNSKWH